MKRILLAILVILLFGSAMALTVNQKVTVTVIPGETYVYSPEQDAIYIERQVPINLTMSSQAKYFKYKDNQGEFKTLCRNCWEYGYTKVKKKPFDDGFHQIVIMAVFDFGNAYYPINFTVDTKKPKIIKTNPKQGFAYGDFEVQFQEENPKSLILNYGNDEYELDIENDCEIDKKGHSCNANVDLSSYDGQEIEYYFVLEDIIGNIAGSKTKKLDVDLSKPAINDINWTINKRRVGFILNITEKNFYRAGYIDNNDIKPRWRILCSKLKDGICEKENIFNKGEHNLTFQVLDKAGNFAEENIRFIVDY